MGSVAMSFHNKILELANGWLFAIYLRVQHFLGYPHSPPSLATPTSLGPNSWGPSKQNHEKTDANISAMIHGLSYYVQIAA
jgi:hypothetical protein